MGGYRSIRLDVNQADAAGGLLPSALAPRRARWRPMQRLSEAMHDVFGDVALLGTSVTDHGVEPDALRGAPRTAKPAIDGQPGYAETLCRLGDGEKPLAAEDESHLIVR